MLERDLQEIRSCIVDWEDLLTDVRSGVVCSANPEELRMLEELFPKAWFTGMSEHQWNLDDGCPEESDLVLASNVFMCARDPKRWLENACRKTRFFIMMDNCVAHRGNVEGETSPSTGDVMRYTMPPHMVAMLPTAFDLNRVADRLVSIGVYESPSDCGYPGYEVSRKFVALFRGDREKT